MMLLGRIAAWNLFAFGFLLFAVQIAAHEIGHWAGRRQVARGQAAGEGVGVLVGGVLALLAFVLALTLSFSSDRFHERRQGTLAEANAIGTAWLRAKAIGQPEGDAIAHLLEQYTRLRIDFVSAAYDPPLLEGINHRTGAMQTAIWDQVSTLVRRQPNPVTASLMAAVNDAFDMTTAERFAFDLRLAPQIFWLLIGLALLGMGTLGYQLALRGPRVVGLVLLLTITWTVVIVDILDLGSARVGRIRTSVAAYEWTLQGFGGNLPAAAPRR